MHSRSSNPPDLSDVFVVQIEERFDRDSAVTFLRMMPRLCSVEQSTIVLDFADCLFVDSAATAALGIAHQTLDGHGKQLAAVGLPAIYVDLFSRAGVAIDERDFTTSLRP